MAEFPEHVGKMLDELAADVGGHLEEAQRAVQVMNAIEAKYGLPQTALGALVQGFSAEPGSAGQAARTAAGIRTVGIRPDEYLGKSALDAAKLYLAQLGHAAAVAEIADAVSKGGAAIKGGADWRDQLEMSMIRSVADVVKVQDGVFGLAKFYTDDQIRSLRATRRHNHPTKKKRPKVKYANMKAKKAAESNKTSRSSGANGVDHEGDVQEPQS